MIKSCDFYSIVANISAILGEATDATFSVLPFVW